MRRYTSFDGLINHLEQVVSTGLPKTYNQILENVGKTTENIAKKEVIGRTTPMPTTAIGPGQQWQSWPPLRPMTIDIKTRLGLGKGGNPNTMLYATGYMASTIAHTVDRQKKCVHIGTDVDYAFDQEYGDPSKNLPSRPFMAPSVMMAADRLHKKNTQMFNAALDLGAK